MSDVSCTICFDDINALTSKTLPCGHTYHNKCIGMWFAKKPTCPVCRTDLTAYADELGIKNDNSIMHDEDFFDSDVRGDFVFRNSVVYEVPQARNNMTDYRDDSDLDGSDFKFNDDRFSIDDNSYNRNYGPPHGPHGQFCNCPHRQPHATHPLPNYVRLNMPQNRIRMTAVHSIIAPHNIVASHNIVAPRSTAVIDAEDSFIDEYARATDQTVQLSSNSADHNRFMHVDKNTPERRSVSILRNLESKKLWYQRRLTNNKNKLELLESKKRRLERSIRRTKQLLSEIEDLSERYSVASLHMSDNSRQPSNHQHPSDNHHPSDKYLRDLVIMHIASSNGRSFTNISDTEIAAEMQKIEILQRKTLNNLRKFQ